MWETLRNVWRVPELRKKVLYTFFMLLIFRLVSAIPTPGVRPISLEGMGVFDLMNMMSGGSLSQILQLFPLFRHLPHLKFLM